MSQIITPEIIRNALTFDDYLALTEKIVNNLTREGVYQNEKTFRYTRSNFERMQQVLEHTVLHQKLYNLLSGLKEKWIWLTLSEPWCGDASWGTPALYIISKASENIDFRILLRDTNPEIMQAYQTNGGNAIPKLVCLKADGLTGLGTWGPRPGVLQQMVNTWKDAPNMDYKESVRLLHAWYEEDKTNHIQDEITELVKQWRMD